MNPKALLAFALTATLSLTHAEVRTDPRDTSAALRTLTTAEVLAGALARFGPEAATKAEEARAIMRQARSAEAAGRLEEAGERASTAYTLLRDELRREAARRAAPLALAPPAPAALPPGYANRREAAVELRKAAVRVAAETGRPADALPRFDAALAEADRLAAAGRMDDAGVALKQAYDLIKEQMVALRSGETLVRSLHFETPEEEFRYELDRNTTFAMLVDLLAGDSPNAEHAQAFLVKARELREAADSAGRTGRFGEGIGLLEASTREYQKVIRNAGIWIPG